MLSASERRPALSPTAQLVADVIAAGGVLRVPAWRSEGEPDYKQRVLASQRFGKVPAGTRLTMDYVRREVEIRPEDATRLAAKCALCRPFIPKGGL